MNKKFLVCILIIVLLAPKGAFSMQASTPTQLQPARGPLRVSAANPRYFEDDKSQLVYLTGSHTWDNFVDWGNPTPEFDYIAYLELLQANHHNFIKLWARESVRVFTGAESNISPLPWERTGPGLANDGKPKFDLQKFNRAFFQRLRTRVLQAGDRGIYVAIMLFNRYIHWPTHPFNSKNNVNGINGDANEDGDGRELHTLASPEVVALQKAYVQRVIDTVNDLDNVLYEVGNELRRDTVEWQYELINFIRNYEGALAKQHPVGMTSTGAGPEAITNAELFQSPADWISPRTEPSQNYSFDPPASDGSKVVITDTDHLSGVLNAPSAQWVWKSFLRGLNPIVMDVIQNRVPGIQERWNDPDRPFLASTRRAMGHTRQYANRINLAKVAPCKNLSSTKYCLADPETGYLIYIPSAGMIMGRGNRILHWLSEFSNGNRILRKIFQVIGLNETVTIDLSQTSTMLDVEWFNPITGETINTAKRVGGSKEEFTAPFPGDAILYIHQK